MNVGIAREVKILSYLPVVLVFFPTSANSYTRFNNSLDMADADQARQVLCVRGAISANAACRVHSHLVDDHRAGSTSVSLLLLHGSWNIVSEAPHGASASTSDSLKILASMLSAACDIQSEDILRSCPLSVATVQVDRDEESEDTAIDSLGAPGNLPALALVSSGDIHRRSGNGSSAERNSGGIVQYVAIEPAFLSSLLRPNSVVGDRRQEHKKVATSSIASALAEIALALRSNGRLNGSASQDGSAPMEMEISSLPNISGDGPALRIFVGGDRSQVGKSSVCLGLLGTLLEMGYPPSSVAYIKPMTQCEATQLVTIYCERRGIKNMAVGPVVYYKGFTRSFLAGETETTVELLARAARAVDDMAQGRRVVVVDGVGYPAVGSICGTDNAAVAAACGRLVDATGAARLPIPVLLVGKSGVGDAIDSFNLNATYFESRRVPVVGAVFNRLSLDGFYSIDNCKKAVTSYFDQYQLGKKAFGFIPEVPGIASSRAGGDEDGASAVDLALKHADVFVKTFSDHVDVAAILAAALRATSEGRGQRPRSKRGVVGSEEPATAAPAKKSRLGIGGLPDGFSRVRLTREQIEQAASRAGAAGG